MISVSIRCFLQNLEKIKVKVFILFFREREQRKVKTHKGNLYKMNF
ncbi:hypothetical protein LEP1GSC040_3749 [Leptospira santarosai str. 2000030832]|uniref:Uncharacterized protein n=1 Tax=Leptospira santarosai serovar Arenal str. MAVJ 401 TaxID=1049976 RepID=M6JHV1_9LEPT|nr:hypothetical protein LEP1GSC040_3749 [Leptospira santarosai str. 2000030832]EMN21276.1 hypothetical protein LEP1GSC063_1296 [Leptospira santarosai serovar Arenal str. MAVJ 401]